MTKHRITIVNHAEIAIDAPPSFVWEHMVADYTRGDVFARFDFRVDPLDDPSLDLGGYELRIERDGVLDHRIIKVTECDDAAMRVSVHGDYPTDGGMHMIVTATYQAVPDDTATLYRFDSHSTLDLVVDDGASREEIAASIAHWRGLFDKATAGNVATFKAYVEGAKGA